jgi:hypothetical protein
MYCIEDSRLNVLYRREWTRCTLVRRVDLVNYPEVSGIDVLY